ncbi:MAG TPA: hypothetical protein V6D17_05170 [Candidatus Obscuribacterales bacterium]
MPGRDDQAARESIPADQLFSWISLGWLRLYGIDSFEKEILRHFLAGDFPWIHSDCMPANTDGPWLPAPKWANRLEITNQPAALDKKAATNWVTWQSFIECLRGKRALRESDYGRPVQTALLDNVRIAREGESNSTPFYTAALTRTQTPKIPTDKTAKSANGRNDKSQSTLRLTALLNARDESILKRLQPVLELLKEEGIGANRSSGLGAIRKVDISEAPGELASSLSASGSQRFALLSPCIPTSSMLADLATTPPGSNSYTIVSKAGWIYDSHGKATDLRKPTVRCFDSGSIFAVRPSGQLLDITRENHPCFRYGIPFVVEG